MGVSAPCEGGVIALNGVTGDILWTSWLKGNIFRLQCTADLNGDQLNDCLAVGKGSIMTINSKTGTPIWQLSTDNTNIYTANFIADQNNDSIPDILASHSLLSGKDLSYYLFVCISVCNSEKITIFKKCFIAFSSMIIYNIE